MAPIRLAIHGAAGRMGQRLIALASTDKSLKVVAALESPQHPRLGQDAGVIAGVGQLEVPLASVLEGEEHHQMWKRVTEWAPGFQDYQDKTERLIPLIRLSRV